MRIASLQLYMAQLRRKPSNWRESMSVSPRVTHHTARLNGITQHWVSAGDGPPVYLLHGFPETWYAWRKQIPVLAERYTVIAPDLRGYGDTEKPACGYDKRTMANDLATLMDHLGHERAPILGHDRGARVGTRFAKDHRERIDRFVAMDNVPTRILMENAWRPRRPNRLVRCFSWYTGSAGNVDRRTRGGMVDPLLPLLVLQSRFEVRRRN
jgi:pimeloyl-ACP methyl ester carboxylesterase